MILAQLPSSPTSTRLATHACQACFSAVSKPGKPITPIRTSHPLSNRTRPDQASQQPWAFVLEQAGRNKNQCSIRQTNDATLDRVPFLPALICCRRRHRLFSPKYFVQSGPSSCLTVNNYTFFSHGSSTHSGLGSSGGSYHWTAGWGLPDSHRPRLSATTHVNDKKARAPTRDTLTTHTV